MPSAWLVLATSFAATPTFATDGALEPQAAIAAEAAQAWESIARRAGALTAPPARVEIRKAHGLAPDTNGRSAPGRIELRQNEPWTLDAALRQALRHEVAHQVLYARCPAAAEDRLFHEAFAVATSGEEGLWTEEEYRSAYRARDVLRTARVDSRAGRRALSRLLADAPKKDGLPLPLAERLRVCDRAARWRPMAIEELVAGAGEPQDAWIVLSRHSGEVLESSGAVDVGMPFGSTLKPFVVADARARGKPPPVLPVRRDREGWECGQGAGRAMTADEALARSCNGYFLDWAAKDPESFRLGRYAELLLALGLSSAPEEAAEAIGLRPALTLSPGALAQAYRVLAEDAPEVIEALESTARIGTLASLSLEGSGLALKTGTVRALDTTPRLGWVVAVTPEVVAVWARARVAPRTFAPQLPAALARVAAVERLRSVEAQTFALLNEDRVEASCPGVGLAVGAAALRLAPAGFSSLAQLSRAGRAVCLGAPWLVRFPGLDARGRAYAGTFAWSPPSPYRPPAGVALTEGERRARRGASFVFRTTALRYVSGVLEAEDGTLRGAPREALARVVLHNARHSRHVGRPVCDTTHCQVLKGTGNARAEEKQALLQGALPFAGWLPFSQGGEAPWREARAVSQVERVLGANLEGLRFADGKVTFARTVNDGAAVFDALESWPCEVLRSRLKLPSCPSRASRNGGELIFEGQGRGHGEGLDVEWAKKSGLSAGAILNAAYGSRRFRGQ